MCKCKKFPSQQCTRCAFIIAPLCMLYVRTGDFVTKNGGFFRPFNRLVFKCLEKALNDKASCLNKMPCHLNGKALCFREMRTLCVRCSGFSPSAGKAFGCAVVMTLRSLHLALSGHAVLRLRQNVFHRVCGKGNPVSRIRRKGCR